LPTFIALDDVAFHKPISVGNIVQLTAEVIYTENVTAIVQVHARTIRPEATPRMELTNVFSFTFSFLRIQAAQMVHVVPESYDDAMQYITGKRIFEKGVGRQQQQQQQPPQQQAPVSTPSTKKETQ
jgi:acyl-CoA hydrolase